MEVASQGPGSLVLVGFLLIALGFLSRLLSLGFYRRIATSSTRDVTPSVLPGTPWLRVESDRSALKVIVFITYAAVLLGMALVLIGVL
jgi:hypothetical protein